MNSKKRKSSSLSIPDQNSDLPKKGKKQEPPKEENITSLNKKSSNKSKKCTSFNELELKDITAAVRMVLDAKKQALEISCSDNGIEPKDEPIREETYHKNVNGVEENGDSNGHIIIKTEDKNDVSMDKKQNQTQIDTNDPAYTTISIENLCSSTNSNLLHLLFQKHGHIKEISINFVSDNLVNAFIEFMDRESALRALAENSKLWNGRHLKIKLCSGSELVKIEENKTIVVKGLSQKTEDEDLYRIFKSCGDIASVSVCKNHVKSRDVRGFVKFESEHAVESALQLNPTLLYGEQPCVVRCTEKLLRKKKPFKCPPRR